MALRIQIDFSKQIRWMEELYSWCGHMEEIVLSQLDTQEDYLCASFREDKVSLHTRANLGTWKTS